MGARSLYCLPRIHELEISLHCSFSLSLHRASDSFVQEPRLLRLRNRHSAGNVWCVVGFSCKFQRCASFVDPCTAKNFFVCLPLVEFFRSARQGGMGVVSLESLGAPAFCRQREISLLFRDVTCFLSAGPCKERKLLSSSGSGVPQPPWRKWFTASNSRTE